MIPDVNVLVAMARPDHVHHGVAREFVANAIGTSSRAYSLRLLPVVVSGFLRIATHPRIFRQPSELQEALQFVDGLLAKPGVEMVPNGSEWPELRDLCRRHSLVGNRVPDAWIASIVLRSGERLATFDRGFGRLLDARRLILLSAVH